MHQVMTATREHRNANPEYHEASLDAMEILNKDGELEQVLVAPIIAIGVGASEGMTRLALSRGRHVDVDRKWFNAHHPYAGGIYVQHADGSAEVVAVERLAGSPEPQSEAPAAAMEGDAPSAADLDAVAEEQNAADATGGE